MCHGEELISKAAGDVRLRFLFWATCADYRARGAATNRNLSAKADIASSRGNFGPEPDQARF